MALTIPMVMIVVLRIREPTKEERKF